MELNQCFLLRMRLDAKILTRKIDPSIWLTRNHMSFLIDNLQFYLQVTKYCESKWDPISQGLTQKADVLETQFVELENDIKKSKDFEQIRFSHDTFLNRIQYQSFMLNKTVTVWVEIMKQIQLNR